MHGGLWVATVLQQGHAGPSHADTALEPMSLVFNTKVGQRVPKDTLNAAGVLKSHPDHL